MKEKYGQILRRIRESKNVTQNNLALRFDISQQQIAKYERGESAITLLKAEEFAKALDVNPCVFFRQPGKVDNIALTIDAGNEAFFKLYNNLSTKSKRAIIAALQELQK